MRSFAVAGGLLVFLFAAACSDTSVVPTATSSLQPQARSLAFGNPPPPPLSGSTDISFDASADVAFGGAPLAGADAAPHTTSNDSPASCSASSVLTLTYDFLINRPGNNAFLHLNPDDQGRLITFHQTDTKIDAHGTITGAGFSFAISDAVGGTIIDPHGRRAGFFSVQLEGTLTTDAGTCTAHATVSGDLSPTHGG